jgi:hypothetical protein
MKPKSSSTATQPETSRASMSESVTASLFGDPPHDQGLLPGASLVGTSLSFSGEVDTDGHDGVVADEGLVGDGTGG